MTQRVDNMKEMTIKRITKDMPQKIFEEMSALDRLCFDGECWSPQDFMDESAMEGGIVLAVYLGSELAGILAGFTASDTGEILTVATVPMYRRQGIARKLMEGFFDAVPDGTETIALEVRQSNDAAIALYKRFGCEKVGVRKRFYRCPVEDADIMVKRIV